MPRKIFPLKLSDEERAALERQAALSGLDCTNYIRLLIAKDAKPAQKPEAPMCQQTASADDVFDFGPG